jgi:Leucine-rich repeat (LRR) protein
MANSKFKSEKVTIFLQHNEITGTVPVGLKEFENLNLNLAGNKIEYIPEELCRIDGWNQGNVKLVGNCSAVLCPKETFNQFGRQSPGNPCVPCQNLKDVEFLGHTRCDNFTSERDTLSKLFLATGGEFWLDSKSWQSEAPICSWSGVHCEDGDLQDTQGITSLKLESNGLSGTLPSEIWSLPSIRLFNGKGNPNLFVDFEGLANAAESLERLYLSGVEMVSIEGVSAATSLKELHLTGNELKGK